LAESKTPSISVTQLHRAREVFEAAMSEVGDTRDAVIRHECRDDEALRSCVEQLIAADREDQPVLDQSLGMTPVGTVLKPGDRVGTYRIVREIGAGGMGTVYQAEPEAGGESVAIKVVRWHTYDLSTRFQREQAILSRLRHPNIAQLFECGVTETHSPYIVMEYVEGTPIQGYCSRMSLATDDRIGLFRQVCKAVAYLHQNLIVHRDLKPGNVLVTADGLVKLVDFGIAKPLPTADRPSSPASTIAGLMTPDYASPEQIRGGTTSTLTDVYSLGVLLYELLTGSRPFVAANHEIHEVLRRICEEEPPKPSVAAAKGKGTSARELRGELDNIVLKAIRKEPERRYSSVEQLDEDLHRYLLRQPVLAQGDSPAYRLRKFVARNKGGVAAGLAIALLLLAGIIGTTSEARIAQRERARAELQARAAESARSQAETQRHTAEQHRAEADRQRLRAEEKAAEAGRERANAERRLGELQRMAGAAVTAYEHAAPTVPDSSALVMAQNVYDTLQLLDRERKLEPGMAEVLDRTAATVQSHALAADPSWRIPAGWTARESVHGEYRVGIDRRIVHGGQSSLFLRSLVGHPTGVVSVFQRFQAKRFQNARVRLTAFLRSEAVSDALVGIAASGIDARADLSGTTGWKRYAVVMDIPPRCESITILLTLRGSGTLWAGDFRFEQVDSSVPVTVEEPRNLDFTR
jgi:serine/threonine protein kinase